MSTPENKPRFGFMTRNYLVLTLTSTLWGIPASICNTYFSLYVFGLGGTEVTIGLITALGNAAFVVSAIIGGHIADSYGRKRLISIMTVALGLSQFLLAAAPNWQILAVAAIIINMCCVFEPAFWAILADSINERRRGTAFALYSCLSFLPWAIMPSVGGYFIDAYGIVIPMQWAYVSLALAGIASGVIRMLMLSETTAPQNRKNAVQYSVKEAGKLVKDAFRGHLRTWLSMPHSILAMASIYIVWAFQFGVAEPYWIVYAETVIGLTSTQWGIITGVGGVVSIISKILIVGKLLDRFSRRRILLVITAMDTFTYILFIRCGMFIQVLALWIASSIIWSFYEPTYSSIEADLIPEERRGRVFAAFGVAWAAFSVPASLVGGFIYEQISPELSFTLASIGIVVCFILTALFIKPPRQGREPEREP